MDRLLIDLIVFMQKYLGTQATPGFVGLEAVKRAVSDGLFIDEICDLIVEDGLGVGPKAFAYLVQD